MTTKFITVALIVTATVLLMGCAGSVSLSHVWKDPGYNRPQPLQKILVVGVVQKHSTRSAFEYQLAYEFTSRGVDAMASLDGVPKDEELNKETFVKYFGGEGIDAILVTGLVSADTAEYYVPGQIYALSNSYYNTWHGYYSGMYTVHQDPGYWSSSTEYLMESNLYDVATEKLIWRGLSKAVNPDNAMDIIEDLSKTLVHRLEYDGLVTFQEVK